MASASSASTQNRRRTKWDPSPPFRGEREGPIAQRWEGEVGLGERSGIPHLTPTLSAPGGGEGVESAARALTTTAITHLPSGHLGNDADDAVGHDHHLLRCLPIEKAYDLRQGECSLFDRFRRGVARQVDRAAQLAVDLAGDRDRLV